jgi:hypothetical protein
MNILSLPLGADTGGVSNAIYQAFQDVPGWEFRAIISTLNYLDYPRDIEWSKETVTAFWEWADVIHLHHSMVAVERLTNGWRGFRLPEKQYVVEFHGTGFREDPEPYLAEMRRYQATGLVATLDLWLLAPSETQWLSCPVDIERMQEIRRAVQEQEASSVHVRQPSQDRQAVGQGSRRQGTGYPQEEEQAMIRIAHAPTNREIKSTDAFIAAVDRLKEEGHPVELDLIEGQTWDTCLERKAKADIYFDQVLLGYGNNSIECWGMGIPVIAGAQPVTLAEMERRFGSLPFYNATEATIYDALKAMVTSPDLRAEYSQRGLEHVRAWHDEAKVVELLKGIYTRAAQQGTRRVA